jgi:hypothetical protein
MMADATRIENILRGIPLRLMEMYLEDLGGELEAPGVLSGPGWRATLERLEEFQLGSLRVGQIHYVIEGDAAALNELLPQLELKLLRAGA